MTQRNVDAMNVVVDKIANGAKLSNALKCVYNTRNICIPYKEEYNDVSLTDLGLSTRSINALLRARMRKLGDLIDFCNINKITNISGVGKDSGTEIFENILDYCWDKMDGDERESFLIDTVERNSGYIHADVV